MLWQGTSTYDYAGQVWGALAVERLGVRLQSADPHAHPHRHADCDANRHDNADSRPLWLPLVLR